MLKIMRDTGGQARAVSEQEIVEAQKLLGRVEGIWTAPEAAAALAALCQMKETGAVDAAARIVIVLTGAGIKNVPPVLPAPVHLEGDEAQVLARVRKALGL
jgi:threonine synthase